MGVLAKHAQTRQVSDMGCPSEYKSVSTKEGKITFQRFLVISAEIGLQSIKIHFFVAIFPCHFSSTFSFKRRVFFMSYYKLKRKQTVDGTEIFEFRKYHQID